MNDDRHCEAHFIALTGFESDHPLATDSLLVSDDKVKLAVYGQLPAVGGVYRIRATKAPHSTTSEATTTVNTPADTEFDDIGSDAGSYVGYIGAPVVGESGVEKAILGRQTMSDMHTLERRVPGGACISGVDRGDTGWTEVEVRIDSGACDTVRPTKLCAHLSVIATEDSRRGMEYEVASRETIPNVGERHCSLMTEDGQNPNSIVIQCADIHKPLLSVSGCADRRFQCVFGKHGGQLVDEEIGEIIPLHRRGNLYVMRAWIRRDESSDFTRPPRRVGSSNA